MQRTSSIYYFDGGSRPNPGPIETAVVASGRTWFRDDQGAGDNGAAEWLALLHALELALAAGATDVLFIGDSQMVVDQATTGRCSSAHLRPYLRAFRDGAAAVPRVRLKQVPRSRNLAGIALARRGLP